MERLKAAWNLSFSTKVLVPVAGMMVLLLALTVGTVNLRLTKQFRAAAVRNLASADSVFRNSESIRTRNLLLRFRDLRNEPRYKAALQSGDWPTLNSQIKELAADQGLDVVLFTSPAAGLVANDKRDPLLPVAEFERASATAIKRALGGEECVDTIGVGERLFNVVSIPVTGAAGDVVGALTLGSEIGDAVAREFSLVTDGQIVLVANGRVVASTLSGAELQNEFTRLFAQCLAGTNAMHNPAQVLLRDEHYFCAAGRFSTLSGERGLGYLLLCSYEQPLRALHSTQQWLLLVSLLGILPGTALIWWLVRRTTAPLRALRDSAEAVGRGDFSRRVEVTSGDECGELALVFNRMTENVKNSRQELEKTVETLKTTQAQLIQSEKLSGIGEFVAGVAHELNNPLTTVMGFSELLSQGDADPKHQRQLELIHKSALRCQKIVQSLLSFARRHAPERKLSDVNALVANAVEFLHYQLRTSNIEVVTRLDPSLPKLMVDPHQMQQVFLNIINNSRQAMESHRPGGRITITSAICGHTVRVEFADNGPGIPPEHLPKLFDPFFTTKEVGKGTGLGLSLCYGIVQEHGGAIHVRSQPREGATFVVDLPIGTPEEGAVAAEPPAPAQAVPRGAGGGKKVLVIDDERPILEMVQAVLAEGGFDVDVASDGESALRRVGQTRYDLALCDWKMPGLSGQQVYERIRATNPALSERMVFITGDVIGDKLQAFLKEGQKVCLPKPFSLAEFHAAVSQVLPS